MLSKGMLKKNNHGLVTNRYQIRKAVRKGVNVLVVKIFALRQIIIPKQI